MDKEGREIAFDPFCQRAAAPNLDFHRARSIDGVTGALTRNPTPTKRRFKPNPRERIGAPIVLDGRAQGAQVACPCGSILVHGVVGTVVLGAPFSTMPVDGRADDPVLARRLAPIASSVGRIAERLTTTAGQARGETWQAATGSYSVLVHVGVRTRRRGKEAPHPGAGACLAIPKL